jgi:hypothetical protein
LSPSIGRMDCLYFLSWTLVCRSVELTRSDLEQTFG